MHIDAAYAGLNSNFNKNKSIRELIILFELGNALICEEFRYLMPGISVIIYFLKHIIFYNILIYH